MGEPTGADILAPGEIIATEKMGGELGKTIKELKGHVIDCLGVCRKRYKITEFRAYPHDGGLADKTGKRWWLYSHCHVKLRSGYMCNYDMSWHKIEAKIAQRK